MILYRWQGSEPNFGDELNTLLWPRLLPDFFDDNPAARFLGIGSVLDARHPARPLKLVAGSGYGGYDSKPRLDHTWIIRWVRGPRTAAVLGLPPSLGLGDPAVLLPVALGLAPAVGQAIGFMPHFESASRGAWQQAAADAGITLIDPRDPPVKILAALANCKLLLSEALHGVIVADALRIPWIAIRPLAPVHRAKWPDWASTMDMKPRFCSLGASSVTEWAGASRLNAFHATRTWLGRQERRLDGIGGAWLSRRAADALAEAARTDPQLSSDSALDRTQGRMLEAVQAIRRQPQFNATEASAGHHKRPYLRNEANSAYHMPVIG